MLHGNFPFFSSIVILFLNVPFRHADVSRGHANYFPFFVWGCVQAAKPQSKFIFQCTCITLESDFDFFRSLVTKSDLLIQYPNAGRLIDNLPAWLAWRTRKCFKPEAHLLIEKFLSLKKGRSRDIFIANMMEHTRARHEESISIF